MSLEEARSAYSHSIISEPSNYLFRQHAHAKCRDFTVRRTARRCRLSAIVSERSRRTIIHVTRFASAAVPNDAWLRGLCGDLLQYARIDLRDFDQCLRRRAGLAAPLLPVLERTHGYAEQPGKLRLRQPRLLARPNDRIRIDCEPPPRPALISRSPDRTSSPRFRVLPFGELFLSHLRIFDLLSHRSQEVCGYVFSHVLCRGWSTSRSPREPSVRIAHRPRARSATAARQQRWASP